MPAYFHDTSSLVKHYHAEKGSKIVDQLLLTTSFRQIFSRVSLVETVSAFAGKVRSQSITEDQYRLLTVRFRTDLKSKKYEVIRVLNRHYDAAQDLIRRHGVAHRLKTLDAIQLGVALEVHQKQPLGGFVCTDQVLCDVARLEGLPVINPESTLTP